MMKKDTLKAIFQNLGKLFKMTFEEWFEKDPFRQSAVIAYYAIFSIPGLLFLIITITGSIFSREVVTQNILAQVSSTMGAATGAQIEGMLAIVGQPKMTFLGTVTGIFILLVGATGVFVELQQAFNLIWEVKVVPKKGILRILKARLFSFGLILSIAFLLLISLVVSTGLTAMNSWVVAETSGGMVVFFNILNFIFSLAVISVLFGLMFKILPDAKIKWKHVWLGSLITGILFSLGKTALAFYFGKAEPASAYGAAGSIILIMLWVSYSSMITFFGAEFTAAYARIFSKKVPPSDIAVVDKDAKA
jgi:membrane protein